MTETEEAMKDKRPAGEVQAPPGEQTPFERFSDFARRIIAVPKSEIDEQARLYRERRDEKKNGRAK